MLQQFITFFQDILLWLSLSFHKLRHPNSPSKPSPTWRTSSSSSSSFFSSSSSSSFSSSLASPAAAAFASSPSGSDDDLLNQGLSNNHNSHHQQLRSNENNDHHHHHRHHHHHHPPQGNLAAPGSPSSSSSSTAGAAISANFLSLRHRQRRQESLFDVLRPLPLPPKRKILVLDLDETLIHSTTRGTPDFHVKIEVTIDRNSCPFYVSKRPHCDYFLNVVSKWYELVIFTASMPEYAEPVIDWLDPKRLITRRYFRDSCIHREGIFLKNLRIIEPDLSQVLIIDNSPSVYSIVPDNAVPIEGWFSDRADEALLDLIPFLDSLRFTEDVRSLLSLRNITNAWSPVY